MSAVLTIESEPTALRYRLVDEARGAILAEGAIEGIGMLAAQVTHTVRILAEPGVPSVTMLSQTARTSLPLADEAAAVDAMLAQFAQHGPLLGELAPRLVGDTAVLESVGRGIRLSDRPGGTQPADGS